MDRAPTASAVATSAPAATPATSQAQARPLMFAPDVGFRHNAAWADCVEWRRLWVTDPVRWGVISCADIAVEKVIPAMRGNRI